MNIPTVLEVLFKANELQINADFIYNKELEHMLIGGEKKGVETNSLDIGSKHIVYCIINIVFLTVIMFFAS